MESPLLDVRNLRQRFSLNHGKTTIYAVEDLSLQVKKSHILGLVGESGCGKSTTIRAIARLYRPHSGQILLEGRDLCTLRGRELIAARRHMQLVFQDPSQSLNPQLTIRQIIAEPLAIQHAAGLVRANRQQQHHEAERMMEAVGLSSRLSNRFPHEFSGGQRQRVAIARALVVRPHLLLLDEPISSLDVSIQAQVVNLLEDLQQQFSLSYLFVAHDLAMVRYLCQDTAVMYSGYLVEQAESAELHRHPLHPYTRSLLQAIPIPDPKQARSRPPVVVEGESATPDRLSDSCPFAPRCRHAFEQCRKKRPLLTDMGGGHKVACWLHSSPSQASPSQESSPSQEGSSSQAAD